MALTRVRLTLLVAPFTAVVPDVETFSAADAAAVVPAAHIILVAVLRNAKLLCCRSAALLLALAAVPACNLHSALFAILQWLCNRLLLAAAGLCAISSKRAEETKPDILATLSEVSLPLYQIVRCAVAGRSCAP